MYHCSDIDESISEDISRIEKVIEDENRQRKWKNHKYKRSVSA